MAEMRFQLIDETNRSDHFHLMPEDECAYLREYTSGTGWRGGETNQQISNLKKKRGQGGYQYKGEAIALCAREMFANLSVDWLRIGTLVPIPPSKVRNVADGRGTIAGAAPSSGSLFWGSPRRPSLRPGLRS
ncbi:hypothetical protein AB6806_20130 [Bosea sp. RCC_152_1]|uniref:hypothetical protein n=1 Tax=Bosea sp. RCC_152_1 TaxID=3239228 RepID=UPI0035263F80